MREIKFMAFLRSNQRLPNGITLGYEKYPKGIYEVMELNFANETATLWSEKEQTCFEVSFRKIELMQYTGLKDENGHEIYEGDIIEFLEAESGEAWTAKIVFENLAFKALDVEDEAYDYDFDDLSDIEVIGNIYENPEILKDKQ